MMTLQDWSREKILAEGLVSVYKPYGISSTAVTNIYKKITGKKVGHGGTLDPLAEGDIILGIGKGTKLLSKYLSHEKTYRTTIVLGISTEAGDLELPITVHPHGGQEEATIKSILHGFESGFTQDIPLHSAKKVRGKASYDLIRQGTAVVLEPLQTRLLSWTMHNFSVVTSAELRELIRERMQALQASYDAFYTLGDEVGYNVRRYSFMPEEWINHMTTSIETLGRTAHNEKFSVLDITVTVPKGTYIRALATDIAKRVGTVGMVFRLERLKAS